MTRADLTSPRGQRLTVALAVALLHVLLALALVRAFAPGLIGEVVDQVPNPLTINLPPPPAEEPVRPRATEEAGAAAPVGRRGLGRAVAAPKAPLVLATRGAAPVAGEGSDDSAGAGDAGEGTGAGGEGSGTGAGTGGSGRGGGAVTKAVKIAGDINSARDYPPESREKRLGDHVVVALTVGTDGRVRSCRVHRASGDPQADQITCRLATERFRFRPATDGQGNPVESVYGWQQRWFEPKKKG